MKICAVCGQEIPCGETYFKVCDNYLHPKKYKLAQPVQIKAKYSYNDNDFTYTVHTYNNIKKSVIYNHTP